MAAKEFFKWNDHLLKRLEPSEEQQETMQESNYIQNIDQSVTQNGVTVTLTDSVQDQGFLYAFFEVKTDDSISKMCIRDSSTSYAGNFIVRADPSGCIKHLCHRKPKPE